MQSNYIRSEKSMTALAKLCRMIGVSGSIPIDPVEYKKQLKIAKDTFRRNKSRYPRLRQLARAEMLKQIENFKISGR